MTAFILEPEVASLSLLKQVHCGSQVASDKCPSRVHSLRQVEEFWFTDLSSVLHLAHWRANNHQEIKNLIHKKYVAGISTVIISPISDKWRPRIFTR